MKADIFPLPIPGDYFPDTKRRDAILDLLLRGTVDGLTLTPRDCREMYEILVAGR
jgi:hypothetical protein